MDFLPNNYSDNREKVLLLLKSYGEDTLSYFHLQDDRTYFFSPSGKSFLSYKILNRVAVVAADPVGEASELQLLLKSFLQYAKEWKLTPCFIGLSRSYISLLKVNGLRITKIGEEAILALETFDRQRLKTKVKRAVRHIEELGIEIFFFSPSILPVSIRQQIEQISYEWVQTKGGREKGFSMTLKRLPNAFDKDCKIAVAVKDSLVVGYLCFMPTYQGSAVSLDQARKRKDSPNGLNEFLIVKSAEYFKQQRIKNISLNFATFSNVLETESPRSLMKRAIFKILETHFKSKSLRTFNEKFSPAWVSRYIAFSTFKHLPLYLIAIIRSER